MHRTWSQPAIRAGWGRGCARAVAAALVLIACGDRMANAQGSWWGWGLGGNPTTTWATDKLADYLLTGQPPHPAVARIIAPESSGTSMGSGVLVDVNRSQGLVLTNWHVVRESRSAVLVQFPNGFQSAGTVVRWDEAWDLAAIVIWKPDTTPVSIAMTPPQPGEPLTIAGFGRGAYREETGACTEYLSPGTGYPKEFVELRATARQGDSGGPIFNSNRELAGVLFGQNDGHTIGSCSTRVRTFLAAVGSQGFTPTPIAEFSDVKAIDRGLAAGTRLAVTPVAGTVERATHVAAPVPPAPGLAAPPQFAPAVAPAPVQAATPAPAPIDVAPSPLSAVGLPPWLPDPFVHGSTLLSGAGGLALFAAGLKMLFGGRRS